MSTPRVPRYSLFADNQGVVPRPERDKRIAFMTKVLPDLKAAVERLAEENNRSASNTAETIMLEWFREHRPDLLEPPKG